MKIISTYTLLVAFLLCMACNRNLDRSLQQASENRGEMEKVLAHFKDDPDTLKYSAAVFLIENMPYHYTQDGKGVYSVDSAYLAMAEYPKEQREKVFKELTKDADMSEDSLAIDIRTVKADYLIKVIDEACDLWHEVNWNNEYSSQLFFDYVLPYRLLDEPLSDWKEAIRQTFPSLHQNNVFSNRGMQMEIEDLELTGCAASEKLGASKDKFVLLDIPNLSFPMGEGLHRILSYQSYASGDNDRVHTLSFWDMRYREECTTSQNTGDVLLLCTESGR